MRGVAGPTHAILDHPAVVIHLMRIDEGIVHADVGQAAAKDERVYAQSPQQDFKVGPEEC